MAKPKICIVTDTWQPNINGVVTTLVHTVNRLYKLGYDVLVIEPSLFKTIPAPGYPEVKLAWNVWNVPDMIAKYSPDAIHIATEGPIGLAARLYCGSKDIPFNSSYHSKFPEYFNQYYYLPISIGYNIIRSFHQHANKVLVTTELMRIELVQHGFNPDNIIVWNRGVDRTIFNSTPRGLPSWKLKEKWLTQPILLYVGRVSKEKGLEDFCSLDFKGCLKVIVGDGPFRPYLEKKYPDVMFVGYKHGEELATYYANADVFVFPSRTDTFGIVMLESISCGTPVAAYPVTGPKDIIIDGVNGFLDVNLRYAVKEALSCNRLDTEISAEQYDWNNCTQTFIDNLAWIDNKYQNGRTKNSELAG